MKNYKVEFLPGTLQDLEDIFDYILLEESKEMAEEILDSIMTSLERLETFPNSGAFLPDKKLRNLEIRMVVSSPYLAFYRVLEDKVLIYHIVHGARNYKDLFKKYM